MKVAEKPQTSIDEVKENEAKEAEHNRLKELSAQRAEVVARFDTIEKPSVKKERISQIVNAYRQSLESTKPKIQEPQVQSLPEGAKVLSYEEAGEYFIKHVRGSY